MSHWTLLRAARLGYLAGRGLSVNSIMADDTIAARSERAVRVRRIALAPADRRRRTAGRVVVRRPAPARRCGPGARHHVGRSRAHGAAGGGADRT